MSPRIMESTKTRRALTPGTPLTTVDVARALNLTPDTVRFHVRAGTLRTRKTPGGQNIYDADDVERFRQARKASQ